MPGLVLLRHGESLWNRKNIFTGWVDIPLSVNGIDEALAAGDALKGIKFDIIYTSLQIRAIQTAMLVMSRNESSGTPVVVHDKGKMSEWARIYDEETKNSVIPVIEDWRLNERYYGELQGRNKEKTGEIYGEEQLHIWRRSYDVPPPGGECLKDTAARTIPFFRDVIIPGLEKGENILVSAHGNSLRSIVMHIDGLSEKEVLSLEIPTGKPVIYEYKGKRFYPEKPRVAG